MIVPFRQFVFPEDRSVKGVSRDQEPFRRELNRIPRAIVQDVEDPSVRRDERIEARRVLVTPRPARAADPLHPPGRTDHRIMGYGIATGVVEIMRPFVDLLRTRLANRLPYSGLLDIGDTVGGQDAHNFAHDNTVEVLRDNEVDEVVDVWQLVAAQPVDRYPAVKIERENMFAGLFNILYVVIETMHHVAVIRVQCGGQTTIPASDMNDEAAFDVCRIQNLLCFLLDLPGVYPRNDERDHKKISKHKR